MLALKLISEPSVCYKRVDTLETQITKTDQRDQRKCLQHTGQFTLAKGVTWANGEMIGLSTINGETTINAQEISKWTLTPTL